MSTKQLKHKSPEQKIALCYIRQSRTIDEEDTNSPKRQRDNIERVCARNGWIPEWYEDVGGHRSGTSEDNRPEWVALKNRLSDPDVVALVANDLSRLHRNLAGISQLIETLERAGISLVLAASNNDIDVTTLTGQMFAQIRGLMDAFYARDISAKAKDSIAYRKRQGKTIGIPPFGTERNEEGYLVPTSKGAWLLPDGRFVAGKSDKPPVEGALWRSYYECAKTILSKFAQGEKGMHHIAYEINEAGWAFRDRKGQPRPIEKDDIRRVLSNWSEYGGLVYDKRAKDRHAYDPYTVEEIPFNEERAVFPVELLREVARKRQERSVRPVDIGVKKATYPYPLGGLVYCAHCDRVAEHQQNPNLRTLLGGHKGATKRRYRHKDGIKCGCINRSVDCTELEADFGRLIRLLGIRPNTLPLLIELAIQANKGFAQEVGQDLEAEKQAAIALCKRRIDAAVNLYRDGRINREDYLADVDRNEREIAYWQSRTTETQKLAMELAMCMEAMSTLVKFWEIGNDEERQSIVRTMFTEIVYDLDARRIVSFKLKAWAEQFLTLRVALYDVQSDKGDEGEGGSGTPQADKTNKAGQSLPELYQDGMQKPSGGIFPRCSTSNFFTKSNAR